MTAVVFGLIIIDMSQEQLYQGPGNTSIVPENWTGYANILKLANCLPVTKVFDARLWITDEDNSTLTQVCTVGRASTPGAQLVSHLEGLKATFVKKVQYSSFFESELEQLLQEQGITDLVLTGINTDYCVFATALDAFYRRFRIHLVEDACASFNAVSGHQEGLQLFKHFFFDAGHILKTDAAIKLINSQYQHPINLLN